MLTAFARAFKTPDLRKKLLFTLGIIVLYRIGAHVPVPGVNYANVETCMKQAGGNSGLFALVNMFSGGALLQITIFALGIMPYITASIILQLLTVVIPRLEALKKEGQTGQAKITQYTRYLTVALADPAGHRPGGHRPQRCALPELPGRQRDRAQRLDLHHHHDGHHDDRRYGPDHVARRDGDRPRYRQRHVDPDVHLDRRRLPGRAVADQAPGQAGRRLDRVLRGDRGGAGDGRPGGLRRAGPAAHSGAVREADDRPPVLRRYVHLHPAQGESGGCDSRHLRVIAALHSSPRCTVQRVEGGMGDRGSPPTSPREITRFTSLRTSC